MKFIKDINGVYHNPDYISHITRETYRDYDSPGRDPTYEEIDAVVDGAPVRFFRSAWPKDVDKWLKEHEIELVE